MKYGIFRDAKLVATSFSKEDAERMALSCVSYYVMPLYHSVKVIVAAYLASEDKVEFAARLHHLHEAAFDLDAIGFGHDANILKKDMRECVAAMFEHHNSPSIAY